MLTQTNQHIGQKDNKNTFVSSSKKPSMCISNAGPLGTKNRHYPLVEGATLKGLLLLASLIQKIWYSHNNNNNKL